MFKIRKALIVLLMSTYSLIFPQVVLAHTGLDTGSMLHISLHASIALGIVAVFVFAGVVVIRRLKKERVNK